MEVAPECVDEFLGPGVSGVFVVVLAVTVVLLLVVDDGSGDAPSKEVLPPNRMLVCSGAVHFEWVRGKRRFEVGSRNH